MDDTDILTADEAKRRFGMTLKLAEERAVIITRHGRARYVIANAQLFMLLLKAFRAQREQRAMVAMEGALDKFLRGDAEAGAKTLRVAKRFIRRLPENERF